MMFFAGNTGPKISSPLVLGFVSKRVRTSCTMGFQARRFHRNGTSRRAWKPVVRILRQSLVPVFLSIIACEEGLASDSGRPPNFVIFFTDDQGYGDVGCFGSQLIETPNFDRMAAEGTRFTDFYVQPVCGVSRAALMTGCYPIRVAEAGNTKSGHPVLHPKEITIAEVLKDCGYTTALIGKWHLAGQGGNRRGRGTGPFRKEMMPCAQGFDYFYGTPLHNGFTREPNPKSFITELMRNDEVLESPADMDMLTQKYTAEAIKFITENKDRPFFLYLAHNMPHVPLGASKDFRGKSKQGLYGDVIQELDWSCGQVMNTLKKLGIDENTLMIFTSDNGPWVEGHLAGKTPIDNYYGSTGPLRGAKMMTYDGGLRTPCIMRWPGHVPAGRVCRQMLSSMDLFPSLIHWAGGEVPKDRIIDGRDARALITGAPAGYLPRDTFFFYCFNHLQAVRHGKWKLVLPRPAKPRWCSWSARMCSGVDVPELYDMEADPGEKKNVATEHPEVVTELMKLVEAARKDLGDYNRVGEGARFFDEGPKRPDALRWQNQPAAGQVKPKGADGGGPYPHSFTFTPAVDHEKGATRRDPSDVIEAGDKYYVWYSKVTKGQGVWGYPSGYSADVYYASSPDGKKWTEQGLSVGKGGPGQWDEHGVFTPNILAAGGKYYLFYTGVPKPFDAKTKTAIGAAVAQSPDGPWKKLDANPLLLPSEDPKDFDSMRVDDASFIVRDGKYWFYYKGRQMNHSPGETKMGVAIADKPDGPYAKHEAGPLHPGHEVMVWPQGRGVASMATAAGPRQIYFAPDGIHFEPRNTLSNVPHAPGAFRSDNFENDAKGQGLAWGIGHANKQGDLYLVRFDAQFDATGRAGSRKPARKLVTYDNAEPVGPLRFDFESGDLQGWQVVDGQFDLLVSDRKGLPGHPYQPFNKQGKYHLSTVERKDGPPADAMIGVIESPRFKITGKRMSFLIGGGQGGQTYVALCNADGKEMMKADGTAGPAMRRVNWDVGRHTGQTVFLRIVDRKKSGWGHVTFDDFSAEGEKVE